MSADVEVPLSTADLEMPQKEESVFVDVKNSSESAENLEPATQKDKLTTSFVAMNTAEKQRLHLMQMSRAKKRPHSSSSPLEQSSNIGSAHRYPLKKRCFTTTTSSTTEKDKFVLHNKFLMGGNLSDPLNLNSLLDPNASPVILSPMPSPPARGKETLPVVVPKDITDPLKLNVSDAELGQDLSKSLISPPISGTASRKRKRHHNKAKCPPNLEIRKCSKGEEVSGGKGGKDLATVVEEDTASLTLSLKEAASCGSSQPAAADAGQLDRVVSPVTDEKKMVASMGFLAPIVSPVTAIPKGGVSKLYLGGGGKKPEPTAKVSRGLLKEEGGKAAAGSRKERGRKFDRHLTREPHLRFAPRGQKFQFGNYNRYYGYRNPKMSTDPRLAVFKKEWFQGKSCLDIGCNVGHVTISLAKHFEPKQITGIDIDGSLIGIARKNVRHYLSPTRSAESGKKFPASLKCYGPIVAPTVVTGTSKKSSGDSSIFPNNIFFKTCNYVLEEDSQLVEQQPDFDTIVCLSTTKWIHLNWGDDGLRRLFKRVARALLPGGHFLLEPQPWSSYGKKKNLTETIYKNYQQIKFKPQHFTKYLLSQEVGFKTCEELNISDHSVKGFQRPLLLLTK